jgi:hypothetical protein
VALAQCSQKQPVYQAQTVEASEEVSSMLFLACKMYADSTAGNRMEVLSKTIVAQQLNIDQKNTSAANRIVLSQLDAGKKVLVSVAQDHPLNRRVEVANDRGEIQSRMIKLPEAEFFFRVTLWPQTAFIRVDEVLENTIISQRIINLND